MRSSLKFIAALALGTLPLALHASSLAGQSGTFQFEFSQPLPVHLGPPETFAIGKYGSTDYSLQISSCWRCVVNNFSPSMIDIEFGGASSFSTRVLSGEQFNLPNFDITGITLNTNIAKFTNADVTFNLHDVFVDWQGLRILPRNFIDLTIQGHPAIPGVPEPGGLVLLGTGLLGAATLLRRFSNWLSSLPLRRALGAPLFCYARCRPAAGLT